MARYFGADIATCTVNAVALVNVVQSVDLRPANNDQESTALKDTQVRHRSVRTDDSVEIVLLADDTADEITTLIALRNDDVTFTFLAFTGGASYTAAPGRLTFQGYSITDGAQTATFVIDNIVL